MNTTSPLAATGPNADQIDYWNSDVGERWARFQDRLDGMLQPFSAAVLDVAGIEPGERILDIGCGCGAKHVARSTCSRSWRHVANRFHGLQPNG